MNENQPSTSRGIEEPHKRSDASNGRYHVANRNYTFLSEFHANIITLQFIFVIWNILDRCTNCHVPCATTLCRVCQLKPECAKCRRHLDHRHFPDDSLVCNTCQRKAMRPTNGQYAMGGDAVHYDIPTSPDDVDLSRYIGQHTRDIMSHLYRELSIYRWAGKLPDQLKCRISCHFKQWVIVTYIIKCLSGYLF